MDTRQLLTGLLLALGVFVVYQLVISRVLPARQPQPQPTTMPAQPAVTTPATPATVPAATGSQPAQSAPATAAALASGFSFRAGPSQEPLTIGGVGDDALELTLAPRGAGVESIRITARKDGHYRYQAQAKGDQPYQVVGPVTTPLGTYVSFATREIKIREYGDFGWRLDDLIWEVVESSAEQVVFGTTLRAADGEEELLELRKSYELVPDEPLVNLTLSITNRSAQPLTVTLVQEAATGIRKESPMYEMRRLLAAQHAGQQVESSKVVQRRNLRSKGGDATPVKLFAAAENTFAWTALANRFFGVFLRPLPAEGATLATAGSFVQYVEGTVLVPQSDKDLGDAVARLTLAPPALAPQAQVTHAFEIYAGPKDPDILEVVNPDFVDSAKIYYTLAQAADRRCCTFEPLPEIMTGLLHGIHYVVRNYGVAIMILVIIVRTLLHPLAVYQQKSMYRMQEGMAKLQPKMQAIKEKFANDRVKQNQETMKLYSEEGVNPMSGLVGMLPLFIQMPILVALWTGLNTDIQLRHAPFDGWWITDLAAPDALVTFAQPITIPIIGQLPILGWMFQGIPSLNLLPVLMGISMWLQQKYMPKPGMQAKLEAAKNKAGAPKKGGQMTPQDQLKQQQMMAYMMSIMFPLMFYYMPSGLNLYWMATNVFGIGESVVIRKQLKAEKERREREGVKPRVKKPGVVGRVLKRIADQAEHIQKKADTLAEMDPAKRAPKPKDKGRKRR